MKFAVFTKPRHVEKLTNFLTQFTNIDFVISTSKQELSAFDFDVGVSYCFPFIIRRKHLDGRDGRVWFNYHPAPLPEYPGLDNYSIPIRDGVETFGVTLHVMTEKVDKGEILGAETFELSSVPVCSAELGDIAHYHLFQLFKRTITDLEGFSKGKKFKSRTKSNCEKCVRYDECTKTRYDCYGLQYRPKQGGNDGIN